VLSEQKRAEPLSQREGTGTRAVELKLISADFHYSKGEDRGTHRAPTKVSGSILQG